jgi:hypothetical protein
MITFVGREKPTVHNIRSLFRVRRVAVMRALLWLRNHNLKYYGNIEIDGQRLMQLPEDAVPVETSSLIRHNPDDGRIDQESSEYVPDQDMEQFGPPFSRLYCLLCCLRWHVGTGNVQHDDGYASDQSDAGLSLLFGLSALCANLVKR